MALTRRIARPLLASIFIADGVNAVRDPAAQLSGDAARAEPSAVPTGPGGIDPVLAVRVNGGVQIVAGLLLALGKARRLASVALMGSLVVSTHAGHRFWEETDETERAQQRLHFLKNVALFGGLILAAVDTEGAPSLGWRAKRRVKTIEGAVAQGLSHSPTPATVSGSLPSVPAVKATAKRRAHDAGVAGRRARRRVRAAAIDAGPAITAAGEGLKKARHAVTDLAQESSAGVTQSAQQAATSATKAARQISPVAEDAAHKAASLAASTAHQISPVAEDAANKVAALATTAARQISPVAEDAAHKAANLAASTARQLSPVAEEAANRAGALASKASRQLSPVADGVANSAAAASDALAKLADHLPTT